MKVVMNHSAVWLSVSVLAGLSLLVNTTSADEQSGTAQNMAQPMKVTKVVQPIDNPGGVGGQASLRGLTNLEETRAANKFKDYPSEHDVSVSYVFQPPLVPHNVRNYKVNLNTNKCMTCHSWTNSEKSGAIGISVTHYMDRDGAVLADMAPRRYFCLQCHVPQIEEAPLIENDFKPVDSLQK